MKKKKSKYWYKFEEEYCPICGRSDKYKYRVYTKKPKSYWKRHTIEEVWDYCDAL